MNSANSTKRSIQKTSIDLTKQNMKNKCYLFASLGYLMGRKTGRATEEIKDVIRTGI